MGESSSHLCFHQDVPREPEDPWEIPEASLRFPTWWLHSLLWASWEVAVVEFHPHPFPFKSHLIIFSYTSNKTSKTANHYRVPLSFWWSSIFGFVELRSKTALSLSWRCRTCRWGRDDERRRPWVKNCWNSPSEMGIPSTKKCEQNMKRHAHRISIFKSELQHGNFWTLWGLIQPEHKSKTSFPLLASYPCSFSGVSKSFKDYLSFISQILQKTKLTCKGF